MIVTFEEKDAQIIATFDALCRAEGTDRSAKIRHLIREELARHQNERVAKGIAREISKEVFEEVRSQ